LSGGNSATVPWSFYQVHGNVYEWTEGCWHVNYQGAPADGSFWTGGDCGSRVIRGGSWDYDAEYLRSASRLGYAADTDASYTLNLSFLSFRVVRGESSARIFEPLDHRVIDNSKWLRRSDLGI